MDTSKGIVSFVSVRLRPQETYASHRLFFQSNLISPLNKKTIHFYFRFCDPNLRLFFFFSQQRLRDLKLKQSLPSKEVDVFSRRRNLGYDLATLLLVNGGFDCVPVAMVTQFHRCLFIRK